MLRMPKIVTIEIVEIMAQQVIFDMQGLRKDDYKAS